MKRTSRSRFSLVIWSLDIWPFLRVRRQRIHGRMSCRTNGLLAARNRKRAVIVASTAREALEETNVLHLEQDLKTLVHHGKSQGYLTYDEINAYLPDQDVTPEKLDNLLIALDESGIELLDKAPVKEGCEEVRKP